MLWKDVIANASVCYCAERANICIIRVQVNVDIWHVFMQMYIQYVYMMQLNKSNAYFMIRTIQLL